MTNNWSIEELKNFISNEVFFANEAAKYLGITSQRLHQLVQTGKIIPVKSSRAGNLFLRSDLEERIQEMKFYNEQPKSAPLRFNNDPKVIDEAINYFTVHFLCKHSDSKTRSIFDELNLYIDTSEPFINQLDELHRLLGFPKEAIEQAFITVSKGFNQLNDTDYIVRVGQDLYPSLLQKIENPPRFLFMRGNVGLLNYPAISVVGTRNPSAEGQNKASALATILGKYRIVVASGLAKGIDRAAHEGALSSRNPTIAVIGTPLTKSYPKENSQLQDEISRDCLVISQFSPTTPVQKWNFPARNAVMSGISLATVIIEAGETSGALIQANYALKQGRLVFIPQSALNDSRLNWPKKYINKPGAHSFSRIDELLGNLQKAKLIKNEEQNFTSNPIGANYVHRSD